MLVEIGNNSFDLSPEATFEILFKDSPNPMCLIYKGSVIDFNASFIERCGFNSKDKKSIILNFISCKSLFKNEDDFDICTFECLTAKGKKFGGDLILSNDVDGQDLHFGFIDVKWIDGIEAFAQALDKINQIFKDFVEAKDA